MTEYQPGKLTKYYSDKTKVFLAGTIDMGNSENWQAKFIDNFCNYSNIDFYNPRRDDWDCTWNQSLDDINFVNQVNWELNSMDYANIIIFNFLPNSKSPVTMLELGLHASSGKCFVCCPKEFYRSGNVHIICDRFDIPLFENIEDLIINLKAWKKYF